MKFMTNEILNGICNTAVLTLQKAYATCAVAQMENKVILNAFTYDNKTITITIKEEEDK